MKSSHLIVFLLGALLAWLAQGWRMGEQLQQISAKQAQALQRQAEDNTEAIRHAIKAERSHHVRITHAVSASRTREVHLRRDAAAARTELERLRDASAAAVRAAQESAAACPERAAALQAVFDQCAGALAGYAEQADRHANDARTLIEAWPIDVPRVADSPAPHSPPTTEGKSMSSALSNEDLELLTPEERAAIADDDDDQAAAGLDDGDDGDDGEGAGDDGAGAAQEVAAAAAEAPAPAAQAAAAPAAQPAAAAPAPAPAPVYKADLPEDFDARRAAISTQLTELREKFKAGDIEIDEYEVQRDAVAEQSRELDRLALKAEIAKDMTQQSVEYQFNQAIDRVSALPAEQGGINYRTDADAMGEFNAFLNVLGRNEANADKDAAWFVAEAHKRVLALRGVAPVAAAPAAPAAAASAQSAKQAAQEARKPPVASVPANLSQVPGGDGPGDLAGEFAHLDALEGEALEDAIARMSPAQREKFAAGR